MRCTNPQPFLEEDLALFARDELTTCRGNRLASMLYGNDRLNDRVLISEVGRPDSVESLPPLQPVFVWRYIADGAPPYWTHGFVAELAPGSAVTVFQNEVHPSAGTPLRAGDILCGTVGDLTVRSVDTVVEDWWDGCADPNWLDVSDDATTEVQAGNPRSDQMITVVALGDGATVLSDGVTVGTLGPWESAQYSLNGTHRAFNVEASHPVLVGTSCELIEPASECRQQTGLINMPPVLALTEGYAHVLPDSGAGDVTGLAVWRFVQPTQDTNSGITQPSHWVRSRPGEAAEAGVADRVVYLTGPFWAGNGLAPGDLACAESSSGGSGSTPAMVAVDILQSSATAPVTRPDRCIHHHWHHVASAATDIQRFVPENATKITIASIGGDALFHSGGSQVATLLPWQTQELPVTGQFPSFSITSSALVVVGTSCALIEPTSECRQQTGIINMPPRSVQTEGYAHVQPADPGANPALSIWRYIQATEDSDSGVVQPSHWVRSSPLEAADAIGADGVAVYATGRFWGDNGVATGDLACAEIEVDIIQSSSTGPVTMPDICVDRHWHRVALAATAINRFTPEYATKITVVSIGGDASVHSGASLVASLAPWQPIELAVAGRFPSFSIEASALVVVGTSCALIEPTSECRIGRGWVYMPPAGETPTTTYVRAADADGGDPLEIWAWRRVQSSVGLLPAASGATLVGTAGGFAAPSIIAGAAKSAKSDDDANGSDESAVNLLTVHTTPPTVHANPPVMAPSASDGQGAPISAKSAAVSNLQTDMLGLWPHEAATLQNAEEVSDPSRQRTRRADLLPTSNHWVRYRVGLVSMVITDHAQSSHHGHGHAKSSHRHHPVQGASSFQTGLFWSGAGVESGDLLCTANAVSDAAGLLEKRHHDHPEPFWAHLQNATDVHVWGDREDLDEDPYHHGQSRHAGSSGHRSLHLQALRTCRHRYWVPASTASLVHSLVTPETADAVSITSPIASAADGAILGGTDSPQSWSTTAPFDVINRGLDLGSHGGHTHTAGRSHGDHHHHTAEVQVESSALVLVNVHCASPHGHGESVNAVAVATDETIGEAPGKKTKTKLRVTSGKKMKPTSKGTGDAAADSSNQDATDDNALATNSLPTVLGFAISAVGGTLLVGIAVIRHRRSREVVTGMSETDDIVTQESMAWDGSSHPDVKFRVDSPVKRSQHQGDTISSVDQTLAHRLRVQPTKWDEHLESHAIN